MSLIWMNGHLVDKSEARLSPFDHGLLYGDGVWEQFRVFKGRLFRATEQLRTLFDAAQVLRIALPMSQEELLCAVEATVEANDRREGYIRVIVTRGPGTLGPDPRKMDAQVIIIAEEYQPFPRELAAHGLHTVTVPHPLIAGHPLSRIRTLGRPHVVAAKSHALRQGCLEALLTTDAGTIIGGTEGMLMIVKAAVLTLAEGHIADAAGLAAFEQASQCSVAGVRREVTRADVLDADEAFLAGTSCGVIAVVQVDGKRIGSGREGTITRQIRDAYCRFTVE